MNPYPAYQPYRQGMIPPKKAKFSVPALILAIAALALSLCGSLLTLIHQSSILYFRFDIHEFFRYMIHPSIIVSTLSGIVIPIAALVAVLLKKKPVALMALILTCVCFGLQIVGILAYDSVIHGRITFPGIALFYRMINGENLLQVMRYVFNFFSHPNLLTLCIYFPPICYVGKNILALASCLIAMLKKK